MVREKAGKATLLGIATALIPWAIQQLLAANHYRAGVALVFGFGALYAHEHLTIKRIPASAEDFKNLSADLGEEIQDRVDGDNS